MEEAVRLLPSEVPGMTGRGYDWPPGLLYLLGILAEGGASVPQVDPLLEEAWDEGVLLDRKAVLEVCSVADPETCRQLLAQGFASRSEWLRQEAFQQMRRVPKLAPKLEDQIRQMLLDRSVGGKLRRERRTVLAQLRRLPNPGIYERVLRLLVAAPFVHLAAVALLSLLLCSRRPSVVAGGDGSHDLRAEFAGLPARQTGLLFADDVHGEVAGGRTLAERVPVRHDRGVVTAGRRVDPRVCSG